MFLFSFSEYIHVKLVWERTYFCRDRTAFYLQLTFSMMFICIDDASLCVNRCRAKRTIGRGSGFWSLSGPNGLNHRGKSRFVKDMNDTTANLARLTKAYGYLANFRLNDNNLMSLQT